MFIPTGLRWAVGGKRTNRYVCARCGASGSRPRAGKCPGTNLPHEWIERGRKYACRYCGTVRSHPSKGRCPARRGMADPYHLFMVIEV